jgi:hypothetical protein
MKRRRKEQEQLEENAYQLRQWRAWHRDELAKLLAGPHGAAMQALLEQLKHPTTGKALVALVKAGPWQRADSGTRAEILGCIDRAIVRQRERSGLLPFDDPLFEAPSNVFLTLRDWLRGEQDFPQEREARSAQSDQTSESA